MSTACEPGLLSRTGARRGASGGGGRFRCRRSSGSTADGRLRHVARLDLVTAYVHRGRVRSSATPSIVVEQHLAAITAREDELHAFNLVLADPAWRRCAGRLTAPWPPAAIGPAGRRAGGAQGQPLHDGGPPPARRRSSRIGGRRTTRPSCSGSPRPARWSSARPTSTSSPWVEHRELRVRADPQSVGPDARARRISQGAQRPRWPPGSRRGARLRHRRLDPPARRPVRRRRPSSPPMAASVDTASSPSPAASTRSARSHTVADVALLHRTSSAATIRRTARASDPRPAADHHAISNSRRRKALARGLAEPTELADPDVDPRVQAAFERYRRRRHDRRRLVAAHRVRDRRVLPHRPAEAAATWPATMACTPAARTKPPTPTRCTATAGVTASATR